VRHLGTAPFPRDTRCRQLEEKTWASSCNNSSTEYKIGSIYALIALGYTMVYSILRLINFAHADIFMVGAYMGFFLALS